MQQQKIQLSDLKNFDNNVGGVYVIFYQNLPYYCGMSSNLKSRIADHRSSLRHYNAFANRNHDLPFPYDESKMWACVWLSESYQAQIAMEALLHETYSTTLLSKAGTGPTPKHGYIITMIDGSEIKVSNLAQFCRRYDLSISAMAKVANNRQRYHKGFACRKATIADTMH